MLGSVSVDELADELQRHTSSPEVQPLLFQLRKREIDLKEFCRRVRMLLGSEMLMVTVKGLQQRQQAKKDAVAAAGGKPLAPPPSSTSTSTAPAPPMPPPPTVPPVPPAPPAATIMPQPGAVKPVADGGAKIEGKEGAKVEGKEGTLGTKVLIHALLCPRAEGKCPFHGCTTMKKVLARVEAHTKQCSISNLPGGQSDCTTCIKWQSMNKLRDHYRRKLVTYMTANGVKAKQPALGSSLLNKAAPGGPAAPGMPAPVPPSAPSPSLGDFSKFAAASAGGSAAGGVVSSSAKPPAKKANTKAAAPAAMQPMPLPLGMDMGGGDATYRGGGGMGMGGGINNLVQSLAGGSGLLSGPGHDQWKESAIDDMLSQLSGPSLQRDQRGSKRPLLEEGEDGAHRMDDASSEKTDQTAPKPRAKSKAKAKAAKKEKEPVVSRSGRAVNKPSRTTSLSSDEGLSDTASDGDSLTGYLEEEAFMHHIERAANDEVALMGAAPQRFAENDSLLVGQHVVVDISRPTPAQGGVQTDDPSYAIQTSQRPEASNVGRVTAVLTGGGCHVKTLCNCAAGDGVKLDGVAKMSMGGDSCVPCRAGKDVKNIAATQRQIVCSSCFHVNLPMALPQMFCSGCAKLIKSGTRYHKDQGQRLNIKLCHGCFSDIQAGQKPEYLQDVDLDPKTFEIETWNAKEQVEYDHMVQCEGTCGRWYHYICAMYPDHVTLPADYRLESQSFICDSCVSAGGSIENSSRLLALKHRRASHLRAHPLSDSIEKYMFATIKRKRVKCDGLVVRVVSSRNFNFRALESMKERYGQDYPDNFPYDSRAIFAFQEIEGAPAPPCLLPPASITSLAASLVSRVAAMALISRGPLDLPPPKQVAMSVSSPCTFKSTAHRARSPTLAEPTFPTSTASGCFAPSRRSSARLSITLSSMATSPARATAASSTHTFGWRLRRRAMSTSSTATRRTPSTARA